ncbi:hypothetical protein [Maribacter sp. HTCC2170]|uniref:hypothetical protein n=1 Tax=Maribacter sp. (strain HTCC2170 / KCCM 42371) TaxID=313603 RepID=UPI00006B21CA|nr:hypothetical protein [Maribacter sp. HTCC2170]EAR00329.1 hypothetical protein FB2170_12946 [Maribacter sp. HTCC2170]
MEHVPLNSRYVKLFFICFCSIVFVQGQQKPNITVGAGIPELLNLGIRYEFNENNIFGLSIGSTLSKNEDVLSLSGSFFHHFGGKVNKANRKRTYFRMGLGYLREDGYSSISKYGTLDIRIGWDFSLGVKTGIQLGIGPMFIIAENEIEKFENDDGWFDFDFKSGSIIYPSIGITLYHRL